VLFPTHLAAASLLSLRGDLPPVWAVAGAAVPDLLDKPIAMAGLYRLYHSVGHSVVVLVGVTVLGFAGLGTVASGPGHATFARDSPRWRAGAAVWVGWASHLALDAVHVLFNGRPGDVRFLAWPLLEHTPAVRLPPLEFAVHYVATPAFFIEVAVWVGVVAVLARRVRDTLE
jgi:hypothetical protein